MSDITERLHGAKIDTMDASLLEKATDIYAYILEIIGMSEDCLRRKRFKQWGRAALLCDDGIQEAITKLNRYMSSEVGLVIHQTYGRVGDLQNRMQNLETHLGSVVTGMDSVRKGFEASVNQNRA